MTAPKTDAVNWVLDKLERCYADMGLQVTEQETVPAARAEWERMQAALDLAYDAIDHRKTVVRATLRAVRGGAQ